MIEEYLTYRIRGAIYAVYNTLGPGLYEHIYEKALIIELEKSGLRVRSQVPFNAKYNGRDIWEAFKLDLLVEETIIIEIKSVEALHAVHHKQLITYLKLTNLRLGLLVNFNTNDLSGNIVRKLNTAKMENNDYITPQQKS